MNPDDEGNEHSDLKLPDQFLGGDSRRKSTEPILN